jgi:hypothetical protein
MTDGADHETRRSLAIRAFYCAVPYHDVRRLVEHLEHEAEKSFLQNPSPAHIWTSVQRVRDWVNRGKEEV